MLPHASKHGLLRLHIVVYAIVITYPYLRQFTQRLYCSSYIPRVNGRVSIFVGFPGPEFDSTGWFHVGGPTNDDHRMQLGSPATPLPGLRLPDGKACHWWMLKNSGKIWGNGGYMVMVL